LGHLAFVVLDLAKLAPQEVTALKPQDRAEKDPIVAELRGKFDASREGLLKKGILEAVERNDRRS